MYQRQVGNKIVYQEETKPLVQWLSEYLQWHDSLTAPGSHYSTDWAVEVQFRLEDLVAMLPSGSGIDCGTKLMDASTPRKLKLLVEYHHMNENGYYDGWTTHVVTVTPEFGGFDLHISGRDRNDIKDYLGEMYHHALSTLVTKTWKYSDDPEYPKGITEFTPEYWIPVDQRKPYFDLKHPEGWPHRDLLIDPIAMGR